MSNLVSYPCNLCKTESTRVIIKQRPSDQLTVVECTNCGLIYVNPRYASKEIDGFYDENYYSGQGADPTTRYTEDETASPLKRKTTADFDISVISDYVKPGELLLDLGCGLGYLMDLARNRGLNVEGTDISAFACDYVEKKGFRIWRDTNQIPSQRFDIVATVETLEHAGDPETALATAYRVLKPNGRLYIWTRNFDGFAKAILAGRSDPDRERYIDNPSHLHFYTTDTMKKLLKKVGFRSFIEYNPDIYYRKNIPQFRSLYKLLPQAINHDKPVSLGEKILWTAGRQWYRWQRSLKGDPTHNFPIAVK